MDLTSYNVYNVLTQVALTIISYLGNCNFHSTIYNNLGVFLQRKDFGHFFKYSKYNHQPYQPSPL